MRLSRIAAAVFVAIASFTSTVQADNCKGSSECHWETDKLVIDFSVMRLRRNQVFEPGQRIACSTLGQGAYAVFFRWALPSGYCLFTKRKSMTTPEIWDKWWKLRNKCGRCGSVDSDAGGELTFNYVADVRKGCPGLSIGGFGLYKQGLCFGRRWDGMDWTDENAVIKWQNEIEHEWCIDPVGPKGCREWVYPGEEPIYNEDVKRRSLGLEDGRGNVTARNFTA